MRTAALVGTSLAAGALLGAGAGYARWYRNTPRPFAVRELVVAHHAAELPKGSAVVIGDSLVERQRVDDLCGPTLNAGVGSAQASDLIPLLRHVVSVLAPKLVIAEVGTNDHYHGVPERSFLRHYRVLIDEARDAHFVIVGIPGDAEWNEKLQSLARETGAGYVPPIDTTGHTTDGVHFDSVAGAMWKNTVRPACDATRQTKSTSSG